MTRMTHYGTGLLVGLMGLIFSITAEAAEPDWVWVGAVTHESAVIHAGWSGEATPGAVTISKKADLSEGKTIEPVVSDAGSLGKKARFTLAELEPGVTYHYGWSAAPVEAAHGRFHTFPTGQSSFKFAFASCAGTGSNHVVFDEIRRHEPLFFLNTGDLHYEDIRRNEIDVFRQAFRRVLTSERQNRLFRDVAVPYIWDDHDYGPNDSDRTSPSREAALASYRQVVPHYPMALGENPDLPIAQAFTVGRVRIIMTDTRSARDPNSQANDENKTMLGKEQLAWLKKELLDARDKYAMTIWVSSVPWVSSRGSDNWAGFRHERRVISDFIVANRIVNLCIISGDAHMLGADDGSNNTFASDGKGPGFPVYQAAALDRRGSVKGGPYSQGVNPGPGQFGLLHITDRGASIEVHFEGRNHEGEVVLQHRFTKPVPLIVQRRQ